jgi:uncharacterized RDD family membrane protein YckC
MKNIFSTHYYDTSKLMHSNQLEGQELAGFIPRLLALLIDLLALIILLFCIGTSLNSLGFINFGFNIGIDSSEAVSALPTVDNNIQITGPDYLKIILKLLIPVLYFGLVTWITNGYTLGKRLFEIRIVPTNHKHLTLWHSIERSLGYYASSLEFGFGFLQYFIDFNRRTVHDRIAETIVIKVAKKRKQKQVVTSTTEQEPDAE